MLAAISQIPRERFLPQKLWAEAYADMALPIRSGQTISQPYIVALMTQVLKLTGEETVLEIGTGSGYQAAVLSKLCRQVITVERLESLAEPARTLLAELGVSNVEFFIGDGTRGCADRAPFDGILVTAAAPDIPRPLFEQLKEERPVDRSGGHGGKPIALVRRKTKQPPRSSKPLPVPIRQTHRSGRLAGMKDWEKGRRGEGENELSES